MENIKYKILLILTSIALIGALILVMLPSSEICDPNEGCSVVRHSEHSESYGIKNSYIGSVAFILLASLIIWHMKKPKKYKKNLIRAGFIIGSIIAAYFIYLQAFVLKAFCKYCMTSDTSIIIALIYLLFNWKD